MSEVGFIEKSTLEAIGSAVRNKEGTTDLIPVNTLADRIAALPSGEDSKLPQLLDGTVTKLTAEDLGDITELRRSAISYCPNLTELELPDGLVTIAKQGLYDLPSLEKLSVPESLTNVAKNDIQATTKNFYFRGNNVDDYLGVTYGAIKKENVYINNVLAQDVIINNSSYDDTTNKRMENESWGRYGYIISAYSFYNCQTLLSFVTGLGRLAVGKRAFEKCSNLKTVMFRTSEVDGDAVYSSACYYFMEQNTFTGCDSLTDIYVPWAEGEVSNAPWGATNATIHYNSLIYFTVDGKDYQTPYTMTWTDWCNSEYNTGGFYIEDGYVFLSGKRLVYTQKSSGDEITRIIRASSRTRSSTLYFTEEA